MNMEGPHPPPLVNNEIAKPNGEQTPLLLYHRS